MIQVKGFRKTKNGEDVPSDFVVSDVAIQRANEENTPPLAAGMAEELGFCYVYSTVGAGITFNGGGSIEIYSL